MKCSFSTHQNPFIFISQLPNLLNPKSSESFSSETKNNSFIELLSNVLKDLSVDDVFITQYKLDPDECLKYFYIFNLCCNGLWLRFLSEFRNAIYAEIKNCYFSKYQLLLLFFELLLVL